MRIQNASLSSRSLFLLVTFAVVGLAFACGDEQPESALAIPTETAAVATSQALARPTEAVEQRASEGSTLRPSATVASGSEGYDSDAVMYEIFPDALYAVGTGALKAALAKIEAQQDRSQVPVLVETLEYYGGSARESIVGVLQEFTGQDIGTSANKWMEWLGRNISDYSPPEGYVEWKIGLLSVIDPRYGDFLRDSRETSRIDLTEVVFGGQPPDGIPDLKNPDVVTAEEAAYLNLDDRVFGVSINGESRAYPLRIINAHELANDVLGGEPISVMW